MNRIINYCKKNRLSAVISASIFLVFLRGVIYWNYFLGREVYLYSDNAIYASLAKRFLEGNFLGGFHPYWNPGFPLVSIPFYLLTGSFEKAQILVSMASAILLIALMFLFFKRFSILMAFIAAFITAFSASLEKLVLVEGITEPLYILILWSAIFIGWVALSVKKSSLFILTGFLFGGAYLIRTEASAFFMIFILIAIISFFLSVRRPKLKNTARFLIFRISLAVISFIILNIPYIYFQSVQLEKFTISGKYAFFGAGPFYALERDRFSTLAQDIWSIDFPNYQSPYYDSKHFQSLMVKFIANGTIIQGTQKSFKESLFLYRSVNTANFFVGFGLFFAVSGLLFGFLIKKFRLLTLYFFIIWFCGFIWVIIFMGPHYRYLVFALPFFFYLQAVSIYVFSYQIPKLFFSRIHFLSMKNKKYINNLIFLGILFFLLTDFFLKNVNTSSFSAPQRLVNRKDQKIIGDWLRSQNITLIGGRMEGVPFYANAKLVYMPASSPKIIVKYMKNWGVEYLVARPDEAGYDVVRPISNPDFKHPDLTLVKTFEDGSVVWKIKLTDEERSVNQRTLLLEKY